MRAIFSDDAYDELASYVGSSGCGKAARRAGKILVQAYDNSDPGDPDRTVRWFFTRGERCAGHRFVFLGPEREAALVGSEELAEAERNLDLHTVSLWVRPEGDHYAVGINVQGPGGLALCGMVDAQARLRRQKWTLTPPAPKP